MIRLATDDLLEDVIAKARRNCSLSLADAPVIERWAGVRPRSRSRAPMLGGAPVSARSNLWPTAGSRSASAWHRKSDKVMADLILDGKRHNPRRL